MNRYQVYVSYDVTENSKEPKAYRVSINPSDKVDLDGDADHLHPLGTWNNRASWTGHFASRDEAEIAVADLIGINANPMTGNLPISRITHADGLCSYQMGWKTISPKNPFDTVERLNGNGRMPTRTYE